MIRLAALCCLFLSVEAYAQSNRWETAMHDGRMAFQQKHFGKAEKRFKSALKEAERSGQQHRRWVEAIDHLAEAYIAQQKYAEAERLYERALSTQEKSPKPAYSRLALSFETLAVLYEAQKNYTQADRLHGRAKEIREKWLAVHPDIYVEGQPKTVRPNP